MTPEQLEKIKNYIPPRKIKYIPVDHPVFGCLPTEIFEVPPTDSSPCIKGHCESCNAEIWVSEKKRFLAKKLSGIICCFFCLAANHKAQGVLEDVEFVKVEDIYEVLK